MANQLAPVASPPLVVISASLASFDHRGSNTSVIVIIAPMFNRNLHISRHSHYNVFAKVLSPPWAIVDSYSLPTKILQQNVAVNLTILSLLLVNQKSRPSIFTRLTTDVAHATLSFGSQILAVVH
ncbi:hypothetical protein HAX54_023175 [Datura stramonium]|uniref:Uncharacterized protein n=1 Tax=Datura stramonium TaxID=4076 RepID=A0ABS8UXA6_DATST|nr:hypothetical protein [Datura stramonium]